jgi:hypothetical protein
MLYSLNFDVRLTHKKSKKMLHYYTKRPKMTHKKIQPRYQDSGNAMFVYMSSSLLLWPRSIDTSSINAVNAAIKSKEMNVLKNDVFKRIMFDNSPGVL